MKATRQPVRDERQASSADSNRRGAHRARSHPALGFLPYAAVLLVVVLVGGIGWQLLQGHTDTTGGTEDITAAASESDDTTSTESSSDEGSSDSGSSSDSTAEVNYTLSVKVLNSTSTSGLAGSAATKLVEAGWTKAAAAYDSAEAQDTTIYYAKTKQKATAQAIADALGVGGVTKDATTAGSGITVIVGTDYSA